jgi:hypothetical protein
MKPDPVSARLDVAGPAWTEGTRWADPRLRPRPRRGAPQEGT